MIGPSATGLVRVEAEVCWEIQLCSTAQLLGRHHGMTVWSTSQETLIGLFLRSTLNVLTQQRH
jgi:hypothetical protein